MRNADTPRLILASSSPYRRELLERLGLVFEAISPDIDETPQPGEKATDLALRLAHGKAAAIMAQQPEALVIGSDQVAECEGRLLGKPGSRARAIEQLGIINGRSLLFHTAVAVGRGAAVDTALVTTDVRMRQLTDAQIERYVDQDHPLDCAGAFKSERAGIALAEYLRSDDPTALVGLPLIQTVRLLSRQGFELP